MKRKKMVRKSWTLIMTVGVLAILLLPQSYGSAEPPQRPPGARTQSVQTPGPSTYVGTVAIEPGGSIGTESTGDLWPSCWAANDHLYTTNGDGRGFSVDVPGSDIVVNEVRGELPDLTGAAVARADEVGTIWNPDGYNRKPTGMLCDGNTIYLAVQDLAKDFNDVPAATIAKSVDHGRTWTWDKSAPMFDDHTFTTMWFADFGRGNADAPDRYAYVYGLDHNWRDSANDRVPDPQDVYLARVPVKSIQKRGAWKFFAGMNGDRATWSPSIDEKEPVLTDTRRLYQQRFGSGRGDLTVISQGGVTYLPKTKRYLYVSWTGPTFELYESPTPWGPWKHFSSRDFGHTPWTNEKHGGYGTTIPSKFVSADERSMYVQSNVFCCGALQTVYKFSLRKMELVPADHVPASNQPSDATNLAVESGTVPVSKSARNENLVIMNDGSTTDSEDDFDDEAKTASWWGYTWARPYKINRVEFTTGEVTDTGGWFDGRPRVQARRNGAWVDVASAAITPAYPGDPTAGDRTTYTLDFLPVAADGIRIYGIPGGSRTFSSISELTAHYRTQLANGGFEAVGGGRSAWVFEGLAPHGIDRDLGNAHGGANNAWIRTARTTWSGYTQVVPVQPGATYTFDGWFRSSSSLPAEHGRFGVRLGDDGSTVLGEAKFGAQSGYTRQQVTVTIPDDVETVTVFAGFVGAGVDTWLQLDDFTVEEG